MALWGAGSVNNWSTLFLQSFGVSTIGLLVLSAHIVGTFVLSYIGGSIGRMEKKMETTLVYWGYVRENGKENGQLLA